MSTTRRVLAGLAAAAVMLPLTAGPGEAARRTAVVTGPSSSQSPYLLPVLDGVTNTSVLTVGDQAGNGYQMAGIPDGLGAFDNGDGTITLVMNHELGATAGAMHDHGAKGSFVSRWVIDKRTLEVRSGDDQIKKLVLADPKLGLAIARMCSADLPDKAAFYNAKSGKGYDGRIFTNGEEDSSSGRAFAHVVSGPENGTSYELTAMANTQFENVLANPRTGDKTVVIGTDDSTPGQVYVYAGDKQRTGNAIQKAGLTGGKLYGISVKGGMDEFDEATGNGTPGFPLRSRFASVDLGDVNDLDYAQTQELSEAKGVTEWWRPEDGAWDVRDRNVFYFNTTAKFDGPARTWKLTFVDVTRPELGGTVEAVLDGHEGTRMLDNMAASRDGKTLVLNEDPGKNDYLARVYSYNLKSDRLTPVLQHDPARFGVGGSQFLTTDEESSGTIDVSEFFGKGAYLLTTQAHYKIPGDLVEGGQLQLARIPELGNGHGHGHDKGDHGKGKGPRR